MCGVNLTAVQKLISDIGMFGQTDLLPTNRKKTLLHSDYQRIETLHNSIPIQYQRQATICSTKPRLLNLQ